MCFDPDATASAITMRQKIYIFMTNLIEDS